MLIAYLKVLSPTDRFWYERLSQIAKSMGAEIRYARQPGQDAESAKATWKLVSTWLDEGDAFLVTGRVCNSTA